MNNGSSRKKLKHIRLWMVPLLALMIVIGAWFGLTKGESALAQEPQAVEAVTIPSTICFGATFPAPSEEVLCYQNEHGQPTVQFVRTGTHYTNITSDLWWGTQKQHDGTYIRVDRIGDDSAVLSGNSSNWKIVLRGQCYNHNGQEVCLEENGAFMVDEEEVTTSRKSSCAIFIDTKAGSSLRIERPRDDNGVVIEGADWFWHPGVLLLGSGQGYEPLNKNPETGPSPMGFVPKLGQLLCGKNEVTPTPETPTPVTVTPVTVTPVTPEPPTATPVTPEPQCKADMEVRKTGPSSALSGFVLEYVVEAENKGNCPAEDVDLKDTLPEGLTLVKAEGSRTGDGTTPGCPSGSAMCQFGTVQPGRKVKMVVKALVDVTVKGEITNTGFVFSDNDDNDANNVSTWKTTIEKAPDSACRVRVHHLGKVYGPWYLTSDNLVVQIPITLHLTNDVRFETLGECDLTERTLYWDELYYKWSLEVLNSSWGQWGRYLEAQNHDEWGALHVAARNGWLKPGKSYGMLYVQKDLTSVRVDFKYDPPEGCVVNEDQTGMVCPMYLPLLASD